MQHGIIGEDSAGNHRGAPVRRARIAWIALGVLGLAAGCGGETKGTSSTGTGSSGSGTGGSSAAGGGPAALCSVGVRDVLVSEGAGTSPAVAFAGDRYLVVWTSTTKDAGDIRLAVLDAKGAKVTEQAVAEGPGESAFPSVIPEQGGGFLVLWQDKAAAGTVVNGRRIDAQGMPKGAPFQIAQSTSAEARPTAAPATAGDAVAWSDAMSSTTALLNGEMPASKTPIDQGTNTALGGSGANLGATWVAGSKVGAARITSPGAPLTPVLFRNAAGKANAPRVAAHDDGTLTVVWEDNRAGDANETIYLTRIDKAPQAGMEKRIPTSPASANYPDVAWTGSHDAVVYYQFRDGPPAIYLSLVAPDLASSGQDLKISGDGISARYPRITRTGDAMGTLGVVYAEKDGKIRASLVTCP